MAGGGREGAHGRLLDDVALLVERPKEVLHDAVVIRGGRAREQVVGEAQIAQVLPDELAVVVGGLTRRPSFGVGGDHHRRAVLVGAADHQDVVAPKPVIPGDDVGGHPEPGHMAQMPRATRVGPRDGDENALWWAVREVGPPYGARSWTSYGGATGQPRRNRRRDASASGAPDRQEHEAEASHQGEQDPLRTSVRGADRPRARRRRSRIRPAAARETRRAGAADAGSQRPPACRFASAPRSAARVGVADRAVRTRATASTRRVRGAGAPEVKTTTAARGRALLARRTAGAGRGSPRLHGREIRVERLRPRRGHVAGGCSAGRG